MKLSETQITTLTAAAQRPDGNIEPLPQHINAGLRSRVIQGLITRELVDHTDDKYVINTNGFDAIGVTPPKRQLPRPGTKQAQVIALLERPQGASIDELCEATDWQKHTMRAVLSDQLKKRRGLPVTSSKAQGQPRRYRITESIDATHSLTQ